MSEPYSIDADTEFWERHERSAQSVARKGEIRDDVQNAIDTLVAKYSSDEFDARKDIAWYFEQFGKGLRSDMDQEKARIRALELKPE